MTVQAVHASRARLLRINRLGLWLFILSESMLFLGILAARFFLRGTFVPEEADQNIALVITVILLASSWTAYRAEAAATEGDAAGLQRFLMYTILLGLAFVVGVGFEWREGFHAFPPTSPFGTVFFTMTGLHAFHVITGLLFFWIVSIGARRGRYSAEDHWPVEAAVKYWHFVDVVWVFFYPALYLVG
ncbi:MAG: heme-copper oxidase subunit III [Actinomycetia bacterium]|nr:heme-copper oxidase subunit III [Actinomycetes bacterium]